MNAKRLMLLASVMMLAGCIEEIPVEFGSRPQLVMNANLMSGRTDHKVYLTVGTEDGFVPPAPDSRILCYVDDELVAEALQEESSEYGEHCLVFDLHADFKAGDHVRLVAESGGERVYAENVFPEPCSASVDSSSVRSEFEKGEWVWNEEEHTNDYVILPYGRVYSFRMTVEDIPGGLTRFQILFPELWKVVGDGEPSLYWDSDLNGHMFFDDNDPVFENVFSPIPPDLEVAIGVSFSSLNYSRIFTDRLFEDGEYAFDFDAVFDQGKIFRYDGDRLMRSYVRFSVATLNEADWRFYNFINSYTGGTELSEPVITVSNVVGGSGYVAALGMTDIVMELKPLDWSLQ